MIVAAGRGAWTAAAPYLHVSVVLDPKSGGAPEKGVCVHRCAGTLRLVEGTRLLGGGSGVGGGAAGGGGGEGAAVGRHLARR